VNATEKNELLNETSYDTAELAEFYAIPHKTYVVELEGSEDPEWIEFRATDDAEALAYLARHYRLDLYPITSLAEKIVTWREVSR
jgi:hypothetical protein